MCAALQFSPEVAEKDYGDNSKQSINEYCDKQMHM